jgi:hypothetical protein
MRSSSALQPMKKAAMAGTNGQIGALPPVA